MQGLKLFKTFFLESFFEVLAQKKIYLSAFFSLLFLSNTETLGKIFGVGEESTLFIFLSILTALLTFIVLSQVVLIQKRLHGGRGELSFFVPTYLLYNLYYSFLFFFGLLFFLIPGFYVLIFYSMAPLIAVLDDQANGEYFKKSKDLVKKNVSLFAWGAFLNLLLEFSTLLFSPIQNPTFKAWSTFFFSLPDALLTIVMTVTFVKMYYWGIKET